MFGRHRPSCATGTELSRPSEPNALWCADYKGEFMLGDRRYCYPPLSHPFVERLVGTMRREFLDHVLFWNARDLERTLADFQTYYNGARSHASLEGHTPLTSAGGHTLARAELNNVRWVSHCRNLGSWR